MTKPKNAATSKAKATEKSGTAQKHSMLFYISPTSLCDNKLLKRKRSKWMEFIRQYNNQNNNNNNRRKKTYRGRKQKLSSLQPDITIDLLSDDEEEQKQQYSKRGGNAIATQQNQLQSQQPLQRIIVYPNQLELSQLQLANATNIRLIPLSHLSLDCLQKSANVKRKRKCHQPKRHAQPTIVNKESIVLTDESDNEAPGAVAAPPPLTITAPACSASALVSPQASSPTAKQPRAQSTPTKKIPATFSPPNMAQVDEEVTVSLVPRSSTAGSCVKPPHNQSLFPMLPDETTVHTVIANRIYELSLTKLREGLASCGIADFASDTQQTKPVTHRKGTVLNPPESVLPPQPAPVSLKLSSDLSISLISDEEDEGEELQQQAEKLLQQQPQLAVQQIQVPVSVARQAPRRRKLG